MKNAIIGALRVNLSANTAAFDQALSGVGVNVRGAVNGIKRSIAPLSGLSLGVGVMGASIMQTAGEFEASMNRVQAVTGASGDVFDRMSAKAKLLGSTTSFAASEAGMGMEMLARNGMKAEAILGGAIDGSMKLAAATGSSLAGAADLATDVMAQFKMDGSQFTKAVDTVVGATNNSKFAFDDFRLALGQAGGVAGGLGIEFGEFATAIAATSANFASGSDAGTSFKTFIQRLTPESKKAREAMEELGLKFFTATGEMKPMKAVFEELKVGLSGLSEEAKTEKLKTIFGTDAIRTALAAAEQGAAGFDRLSESISNVSADEQAAVRLKGFQGAVKELSSAFEGLKLAIADSGVLDAITSITKKLTEAVRWVSQADPKFVKFGTIFAGIVAAIAPLVATLALVVTTLSAPVVGVIAVIAAAGAAIAVFGDEIGAFIDAPGAKLKEWGGSIGDAVGKKVEAMAAIANAAFEGMAGVVDRVVPGASAKMIAMKDAMINAAGALATGLPKLFKQGLEILPNIARSIEASIRAVIDDLLASVMSVFDGLQARWESLKSALGFGGSNESTDDPEAAREQAIKSSNAALLDQKQILEQLLQRRGEYEALPERLQKGAAGQAAFAEIDSEIALVNDRIAHLTAEASRLSVQMVDGVEVEYQRLRDQVAPVGVAAFDSVTAAADRMDNEVVRNSYVPDMVDGVASEFSRLKGDIAPVAVEAFGLVQSAARDVGTTITSGLKSALSDGKLDFDDFRSGLVSIAERLRDQLLDQAFAPIENAISNLFSDTSSGSGGSGGLLDTLLGGVGSLFSGFFADGGTIPRGKFGIVGERGPELAFGGPGGTSIAPIGGIGTPSVQVTNHFNAGINGADRSAIAQQIQQSERRTVQAVADLSSRSPRYLEG